jgi:hypothetical protein
MSGIDADRDYERHWHLDKQVPVALIATIICGGLAHTLTLVWFASNIWTRVGDLEKKVETAAPQIERIIRLETKVDGLHTGIQEVKALLRLSPSERH